MATESAHLWKIDELKGIPAIRATYTRQEFPRHSHDFFVIGINEGGAHEFFYRGRYHIAPPGVLLVLQPDEAHTGRLAGGTAWKYRALYPDAGQLLQFADQESAPATPFFPNPLIPDARLAAGFIHLHHLIESSGSILEHQTAFADWVGRLLQHARPTPSKALNEGKEPARVKQLRSYLEAHSSDPVSLDQLSTLSGLSPYHLIRVFRKATGMTPHAFLCQQRVYHARALIEQGHSLSQAAFSAGFADQAHLNRWFKRLIGATPGAYARSLSGA